jgi:hypothetical protein
MFVSKAGAYPSEANLTLSLQECFIEYEDIAKTEVVRICSEKADRDCGIEGEVKCETIFVTSKLRDDQICVFSEAVFLVTCDPPTNGL